MSSSQELEVPLFATHQAEMDYWKNLALIGLEYKRKFEECMKIIESHSRKFPSTVIEKNIAKSSKAVSNDPFDSRVLHEYVHPYILQHFSGSDLLKISEVSPNWFKLTESQKVEDKVELKLEMLLEASPSCARDYKSVSWRIIRPLENFVTGIQQFSHSVETLKIDSFTRLDIDYSLLDINFDNLKCLHMIRLPFDLEKFITLGVENAGDKLQEFEWMGYDKSFKYRMRQRENIINLIARQKNLKRLDLEKDYSKLVEKLFDKEDLPFQLEYLRVQSFPHINLIQFQSLKFLLFRFVDSESLNKIFRMPKLTSLEICVHDRIEDDVVMNFSITNLKFLISWHSISEMIIMQRILLALPELKTLEFVEDDDDDDDDEDDDDDDEDDDDDDADADADYEFVESITVNMMEFIATNMMKLETLTYCTAEDGAIERYEAMKVEQPGIVNMRIQVIHKD